MSIRYIIKIEIWNTLTSWIRTMCALISEYSLRLTKKYVVKGFILHKQSIFCPQSFDSTISIKMEQGKYQNKTCDNCLFILSLHYIKKNDIQPGCSHWDNASTADHKQSVSDIRSQVFSLGQCGASDHTSDV